MNPRRIEEASLNSWPALRQMLYDGWLMRFARGYTKRANSVNPIYGSTMDLTVKVEVCETIYRRQGLPCFFRLTPFSCPEHLDRFLEGRGYERAESTLVLHRKLNGLEEPAESKGELQEADLDCWMSTFRSFDGSNDEDQQTHAEMLRRIPGRRVTALLVASGRPVACGLGVIDGACFGLFDIVTDPERRRQGYGTGLIARLLHWAQERGARGAYLQVVEANEPARRTYAVLGFERLYEYWYRRAPG